MRAKRDIQARLPKRRRGAVEGHRELAGLGPLIAAQAGPRPRGDTDDEMEVEEEEGAPQHHVMMLRGLNGRLRYKYALKQPLSFTFTLTTKL